MPRFPRVLVPIRRPAPSRRPVVVDRPGLHRDVRRGSGHRPAIRLPRPAAAGRGRSAPQAGRSEVGLAAWGADAARTRIAAGGHAERRRQGQRTTRRQPDRHRNPRCPCGERDHRRYGQGHRHTTGPQRARHPRRHSRLERRADRRRWRAELGLHPRDKRESHQDPDRRHRCRRRHQCQWCVRLRPSADLGHPAVRGAEGAAERPLWLGCDRWRHLGDHAQGRRPGAGNRFDRDRHVSDLQPVGRRQRVAGQCELRDQCRASPCRRHSGHATAIAAGGAEGDRQRL